MHCKYHVQDYEARMNGGLAMYKNKPVLIEAAQGILRVASFPEGENSKAVDALDPDLDLASPTLGYVNWHDGCLYVYRKPERKYKQTLTYGSIGWFDPVNSGLSVFRSNDLFYSKNFRDMLEDKYPNFSQAINSLTTKARVKGLAISKNVALAIDSFGIIRVYYKIHEVGYINPGTTTVCVPEGKLAWVVSKYLKDYGWEVV